MSRNELLFLDFDGVLCDSLPETLVSSWIAYHEHVLGDRPAAMPVDFRAGFSFLRPLIRSGEDYLLVQEIIDRGLTVADQAGFDRLLSEKGPGRMKEFKDFFYQARQDLLQKEPEYWFSLNPVFRPMQQALNSCRSKDRVYILSTKKSEFILKILKNNRMDFVSENVIDSGPADKAGCISRIMDDMSADKAYFIDDQLSHLQGVSDRRIRLYLAAWGYVMPQWLTGSSEINVMTLDKAVELVKTF